MLTNTVKIASVNWNKAEITSNINIAWKIKTLTKFSNVSFETIWVIQVLKLLKNKPEVDIKLDINI